MKNSQKLPAPLTQKQRELIEKLATEYEPLIKHIIRLTLGVTFEYLTDECVAELCLLMCLKASVLEKHQNPKAWVAVAAKLTACTVKKRNNRAAKTLPLKDKATDGVDTTYEEALYSIWLQNKAPQKLLESLTKGELQVYYKLYVENKSAVTAAKELGVSPATVRNFKAHIKEKAQNYINKKI